MYEAFAVALGTCGDPVRSAHVYGQRATHSERKHGVHSRAVLLGRQNAGTHSTARAASWNGHSPGLNECLILGFRMSSRARSLPVLNKSRLCTAKVQLGGLPV